ncbi:E3 ubiquitin-protein ligase TRIM69-like [Hemicordylus capensis]|uniref:E3 ubiquitin-protein ligase TRIM69-like n=1 Tax=Hemicordylus capensis TaxID=884348 RepID=UPI0023023B48|nr:E3 ubiquitin-protein ligase TRIM69-like [Hemicordylus capensis]
MLTTNEEERLQNHQAVMLSLGDDITTKFRQLHHFLYTCEESWKVRLEEEGRALLRETEGRLRVLKESSHGAQELLLEAQGHLQLQDSAKFLTDIHSLLNRVKQQPVTSPVPEMRPMLQILGQLKGPTQYITWREMKSSLGIGKVDIWQGKKTEKGPGWLPSVIEQHGKVRSQANWQVFPSLGHRAWLSVACVGRSTKEIQRSA